MADAVGNLVRARENCTRLLLLVQEQITNPRQGNVDAIVAASTDNVLTPKPTYSVDGESYQWESYQESLLRQIDQLTDLINKLSAPWEIRSRAY